MKVIFIGFFSTKLIFVALFGGTRCFLTAADCQSLGGC